MHRIYFAVQTLISLIVFVCFSCVNQQHEFNGLVSAATEEAAAAGGEILEAGGNAIDAAVAVSFALAVSEPAMSGLGGGTQIIMHAPDNDPIVINGTSFSPRATPVNAKKEDIKGHRATTIPSTVKTLERLAENGAEDFYSGSIARDIADDMAKNGGWITLEDLRNVRDPIILKPLKSTYRGWDVFSLPPPAGGWVVLQMLNVLENFSLKDHSVESTERLKAVVAALRLGHRNRRSQPVRDLLNFEEEVEQKLDKKKVKNLLDSELLSSSGETTHFSVVDASGMVVGVTASVNAYYGARVASPKLGFVYNDYMNEFEVGSPQHPFALQPNAMPYSSMSPTILAKGGVPHLGVGSPGSSRIISAVTQVIQLWVDSSLGIQEAVAAKRLHVIPDNRLLLESKSIPENTLTIFAEMGFEVTEPRKDLATGDLNPYFGGVHAIAYENGRWVGAADPRRDGAVLTAKKPK